MSKDMRVPMWANVFVRSEHILKHVWPFHKHFAKQTWHGRTVACECHTDSFHVFFHLKPWIANLCFCQVYLTPPLHSWDILGSSLLRNLLMAGAGRHRVESKVLSWLHGTFTDFSNPWLRIPSANTISTKGSCNSCNLQQKKSRSSKQSWTSQD